MRPLSRRSQPSHRVLIGAAALFIASVVWGTILRLRDDRIALDAPPFRGNLGVVATWWVVPALLLAPGMVFVVPRIVDRCSWRWLLAFSTLVTALWGVALALTDRPSQLVEPIRTRYEYFRAVPLVGSPSQFLATFLQRTSTFPLHVTAHPPAMVLVLWSLHRIGLGAAVFDAVLVVAAGVSTVPAVLIAAREVAGEAAARRAAPYVALLPAVLWIVTSSDAFFAGVAVWSGTLLVLASGRSDRRSDLMALLAGLLAGFLFYLTYPAALFLLPGPVLALSRRRFRPLVLALAAVIVVAVVFTASGFWWPDGLASSRVQYARSVAQFRPYRYFVVANLAVAVFVVGPAVLAAFARLRDRGIVVLIAATATGLLIADLTGLSKGEVERIWLPFMPWLMLSTISLPTTPRARRGWLAAQVTLTLATQLVLRSEW